MPPPGRSWSSGSPSSVVPAGSLLAFTNHGGLTSWGISSYGRISYGIAWPGCGVVTGSQSLSPLAPSRISHGGLPMTVPACRSSRSGISADVK